MPSGRDAYRAGTRLLSLVMIALGIAMFTTTLARGGGPLALGVVLGVLFVAAGVARLWLAART